MSLSRIVCSLVSSCFVVHQIICCCYERSYSADGVINQCDTPQRKQDVWRLHVSNTYACGRVRVYLALKHQVRMDSGLSIMDPDCNTAVD
jgi:hypothetical protein